MSREDRGFSYLGRYIYARKLKRGGYSLYQGMYSDRAEDGTAGLEVIRDTNKCPLRFKTISEADRYFRDHYC